MIVLEGSRARPTGELCVEHEITQGQWRDQFLTSPVKAFESAVGLWGTGGLERENVCLKSPVGEHTLAFKSEEILA